MAQKRCKKLYPPVTFLHTKSVTFLYMFLALHAPVRGVQKELSHEVNLFSVPKKLPGVKFFFSLFLAFFVHEKADMYPVLAIGVVQR